jgi:DNA (cytosine-5)-methyltransferase 1
VVRELDPEWVLAENVPGAVGHILDRILADLEDAGYDSLPVLVPTHLYGAEHRRERLFVIAHASGLGMERLRTEGIEIAHALAGPFLPLRTRYGFWEIEPDVRRANDGVSGRMDRLRMLGNAVTPPVAEAIGRVIMSMQRAA